MKRPRLVAACGVLIFLGLGYTIQSDQNQKRGRLQSGDFQTYQGVVTSIAVERMTGRSSIFTDKIAFDIKGRVLNAATRPWETPAYEINGQDRKSRVISKKSFVGVAGKLCSGQDCGLKRGDTVQIRYGGFPRDTLRIEKCAAPR